MHTQVLGKPEVYISFKGGGRSYCEYKIWFNALEGVGIHKESEVGAFMVTNLCLPDGPR